MRVAVAILFAALIVGCERETMSADSATTTLEEPELNDLTLRLTNGYENLRPFLYEQIPPQVFEVLFGDVNLEFRNRLTVESEPGTWLTDASIKQKGPGMLSVYGDDGEPASVLITRHRRNRLEVTIRKPTRWDSIVLKGREYVRVCQRRIEVYGADDGITNIVVSFGVSATPKDREELVRKQSECFEYQLSGRYEMYPDNPTDLVVSASSILFHYDPTNEVEKEHLGRRYTGPELLSRDVFNKGDFELSSVAKEHLLKIMDMVTVYGVDQPENAVYKDLLSRKPLKLRRDRVPE